MKKIYTLSLEGEPVYVKEEDGDFQFTWRKCSVVIDREENVIIPELKCTEISDGDTKKLFNFAYDNSKNMRQTSSVRSLMRNNKPFQKGALGPGLSTYETRYFRNYEL